MSDVESDLRARVLAFVGELRAIVRRDAMHTVQALLEHDGVEPRPARALPTAPRAPAPGEKRAPQLLQQITDALHVYIKSNAGQNVEQISKALATSSRDLTLPLRKLLAASKITSKGQKRATRYFPR